jgi:hypothetical protein
VRRAGLLAVLGFVGLTALAGGLVMALGSWLGPERLGLPAQLVMPESMLAGSPFNSYFLPGLLLALVVGGTARTSPHSSSLPGTTAGPPLRQRRPVIRS